MFEAWFYSLEGTQRGTSRLIHSSSITQVLNDLFQELKRNLASKQETYVLSVLLQN